MAVLLAGVVSQALLVSVCNETNFPVNLLRVESKLVVLKEGKTCRCVSYRTIVLVG